MKARVSHVCEKSGRGHCAACIALGGTVAFCEDEEESDEDPYTWPYNSSQSHHPAQKTQLFHEG